MSTTPISPAAEADWQRAMRTATVNFHAAIDQLVSASPALVAAANNGGTLTCVSCGAKTDARGALPCGH